MPDNDTSKDTDDAINAPDDWKDKVRKLDAAVFGDSQLGVNGLKNDLKELDDKVTAFNTSTISKIYNWVRVNLTLTVIIGIVGVVVAILAYFRV